MRAPSYLSFHVADMPKQSFSRKFFTFLISSRGCLPLTINTDLSVSARTLLSRYDFQISIHLQLTQIVTLKQPCLCENVGKWILQYRNKKLPANLKMSRGKAILQGRKFNYVA